MAVFENYLRATKVVDHSHQLVKARSKELARRKDKPVDIARACFEWVRDTIRHSANDPALPVVCRASEVLQAGHGFCHAQAHLLAALLRANRIPAGFCYQRFRRQDDATLYLLHGLNAVYLAPYGWYRVDASEQQESPVAQFDPPREMLPHTPAHGGEVDLPEIWPDPLTPVVNAMVRCRTSAQLQANLPDVPIISGCWYAPGEDTDE